MVRYFFMCLTTVGKENWMKFDFLRRIKNTGKEGFDVRLRLLTLVMCSVLIAISAHLGTASAAPPLPVPSASLPSAFDLRKVNRVTPAKSPECGTCWTAATMGALESFLMPFQGWDFSEDHLQMFVQQNCSVGGHAVLAAGYFAGWHGPVKETDYKADSGSMSAPVQKHVQNIYYLPEKSGPLDNDWIKYAIMNLGGVYQSAGWYYYPDPADPTYYMPQTSSAHAVTLVGWDDNFKKERFSHTVYDSDKDGSVVLTPPGDGAFIAKNNLGPDFGENGYYYISYYDGTIKAESPYVFTAEPLNNYTHIYQYDRLPSGTTTNGFRVGNVFTAESNDDLAAVGFYFTPWTDDQKLLSYTIEVYLDPTNGPENENEPAAKFQAVAAMGGYYTVKLPKKVALKAGQKFSVVLSSPIQYGTPYVSLDEPFSDNDEPAKLGRGFVMNSWGAHFWEDVVELFPSQNLCIKAFTTQKQFPVWITAVRRFGPDMYRLAWDITNTSTSVQTVKPSAYLYKQGQSGLQRMAGEITSEYYVDGGSRIKMNTGILKLSPGSTVTVISRPGINDLVQKVASNAYTLQDGAFQLVENTWQLHDLFSYYIQVVSTNPINNQNINYLSLKTITVAFDTAIKMGPNFWGVSVTSPNETKFTFNSISGNTLTIVTATPMGSSDLGGTNWTVYIPQDAIQDVFGNRMEKDYKFTFHVTGVN
jgi:C1A family cysteine protease